MPWVIEVYLNVSWILVPTIFIFSLVNYFVKKKMAIVASQFKLNALLHILVTYYLGYSVLLDIEKIWIDYWKTSFYKWSLKLLWTTWENIVWKSHLMFTLFVWPRYSVFHFEMSVMAGYLILKNVDLKEYYKVNLVVYYIYFLSYFEYREAFKIEKRIHVCFISIFFLNIKNDWKTSEGSIKNNKQ